MTFFLLTFFFCTSVFFSLIMPIAVLVSSLQKTELQSLDTQRPSLVQIETQIRRFNIFPPPHFSIDFCEFVLINCQCIEQQFFMDIQFFTIGFLAKKKKMASKLYRHAPCRDFLTSHSSGTRHEWLYLFSTHHECFTSGVSLTRARLVSHVLLTSQMKKQPHIISGIS